MNTSQNSSIKTRAFIICIKIRALIVCMMIAAAIGYFTAHTINEKFVEFAWYVGVVAILLAFLPVFTDEISPSGFDRHFFNACMCGLPFALAHGHAIYGDLSSQLFLLLCMGVAIAIAFCAVIFASKCISKYILRTVDDDNEEKPEGTQKTIKIRVKPGMSRSTT